MVQNGTSRTGAGQNQRTTILDLAEHLSLTKGTVSRALNGYPDIAERTRIRVRKAAEQMGYRPLSHAQAIRTGRVRAIGLVLHVHEHDGHRPFLADFLAGLSASAAHEDWTLTVATAASEEDAMRLLSKLHDDRKVDGFILPRTYEHDHRVTALRASGVPFVLFGRVSDMRDTAYYDIASEAAMVEAVEKFHNFGHERIAYVQGGEGYTYSRLRHEGFAKGLRQVGLSPAPELIAGPAVTKEAGAEATKALLSLPAPPTAILFAVDRAAIGAYEAAARLGVSIGGDLSIMSYDGIPEGKLMSPQLSTFQVDMRQAGFRLVELLIRLIRGEPAGDLQELANAEFSAGGSHGPCNQTSAALAAQVKKSKSLGGKND